MTPGGRVDDLFDRLLIIFVCFWGNWSLYYWVLVFGLDGSFLDLKTGLPVLIVQISACLFWLHRAEQIQRDRNPSDPPGGSRWTHRLRRVASLHWLWVAVAGSIPLTGVALWVGFADISSSPMAYNLTWSLLVPFVLVSWWIWRPGQERTSCWQWSRRSPSREWGDVALLFAALVLSVWTSLGTGFATPDDAFYAHVISSTLSHPDLPLQGQDLLMGTPAGFTISPTYRISGFEVLAALISDLSGFSGHQVYYDVFSALGRVFWILATYSCARSLGAPMPGMAVAITLGFLLHWDASRSLGTWFSVIWLGKGYVASIAAPLVFATAAIFVRNPDRKTLLLLFLAVCAVLGWSTSALFIVPVSAGCAVIAFVPWKWSSLGSVAGIFATLLPVPILILLVSLVTPDTWSNPVNGTGTVLVEGTALGGAWMKSLLLATLCLLPVIALFSGDRRFVHSMVRFGLAGVLTVYAPYWIEILANLSGVNLLSWRMQWAFPSALIMGILVVGVFMAGSYSGAVKPVGVIRVGSSVVIGIWVAMFFGSMDRTPSVLSLDKLRAVSNEHVAEARDVRLMIGDAKMVAAGYLDEVLPIFPDPPAFVAVRFYLPFQRNALSKPEWEQRQALFAVLRQLAPPGGEEPDEAARTCGRLARILGVDSVVYRAIPEEGEGQAARTQRDMIARLTQHFSEHGYLCDTSPSGATMVCNLARISHRVLRPRRRTGMSGRHFAAKRNAGSLS